MKKIISLIISIFIISSLSPQAFALTAKERSMIVNRPWYDSTACLASGASSQTASSYPPDSSCIGPAYPTVKDEAKFADAINKYIEDKSNGSPLAGKGQVFVNAGKKWGVNPALIVNIAFQETGFGKAGSGIGNGSNNPFGMRCYTNNCAGAWQRFGSFDEAIEANASLLRRKYINEGLTTIEQVFPKYAPPSDGNDTAGYIRSVKERMQAVATLAGDALSCGANAGNPQATTNNNTSSSQTGASSTIQLAQGTTYLLGDSIMVFADGAGLSKQLTDKGISNKVNALSSRQVTSDGTVQSGLSAVEQDKEYIKNASNIVIALGTNINVVEGFDVAQKKLIDKIKSINPNIKIFWVDIFSVGKNNQQNYKKGLQEENKIIYQNASQYGYTVIPAFKFVWGSDQDPLNLASKNIPDPSGVLSSDGVHPAGAGLRKYTDFLVGQLTGGVSSTVQSSSTDYTCSGSGSTASGSADASLQSKVVQIATQELALSPVEYDSNVLKYTSGRREPWCADFVSWVYREAGSPFPAGNDGWQIPGVASMKSFFSKTSGYEYFEAGTKAPEPGDVAFYTEGNGHVDLVTAVNGDIMTVIGGNGGSPGGRVYTNPAKKIQKGAGTLEGFGRKLK